MNVTDDSNKEKTLEYFRNYRERNREKINEYMRNWYERNKDTPRFKERQRIFKESGAKAKKDKKYRSTDKGKASLKRYDQSEGGKKIRKRNRTKYRMSIRIFLIELLGGVCIMCGYNKDIRGLELDHINGGGLRERKTFGSRDGMIIYYRKHPEEAKMKLQLLCGTCHNIKTFGLPIYK